MAEMSRLIELRDQIEGASREVTILEKALLDNPGYPSIAANLESALRVRQRLQNAFVAETKANLETIVASGQTTSIGPAIEAAIPDRGGLVPPVPDEHMALVEQLLDRQQPAILGP